MNFILVWKGFKFDFPEEISVDVQVGSVVLIIFIGAIVLTRFVRWLISKSFETASEKLKVDSTRYKFFKNAASFIIWMVAIAAIVSMVPKLRALAITLFAGAGILVAIVGLAAQQAFSNVISGIFLVIFKPFSVGDLIKVGNQEYGIVEDITLRHTVIKSFENKRIIIPNSIVGSEVIINNTIMDQKICRWIEFGISYDSNVDLAIKIIKEVAEKHPKCIDNRGNEELSALEEKVIIRLVSFGDSSVTLRAYVWTEDPYNAIQMHSDINKEVKMRFEAEGIEIPYPYRTVVYKTDLINSKNNA